MSFNSIKPANGYYVLEPVELEKEGAFKLAQASKEKPEVGKIVGVGGSTTIDPDYDMLDVVAYRPYTASTIKLGGKELGVVKFEDVLGKLVEDAN